MELPELWDHQKTAIQRASNRTYFGLLMEPGTGKTRTMLEILRGLYNGERRVLHTLIFAPPVVLTNWAAEIARYTKIPADKVVVLSGPGPRRRKALAQARINHPTGFIAISNYEGLVSVKDLFADFKSWKPEVLILDESHKVKTHNSKRTKKAIELGDLARYRYILTGSAILNSAMDIWSQFRVMDRGAIFGGNFWAFRATYFIDKNASMPKDRYFPDFVLRPGALERIEKAIHTNAMIVKKEECLDLPPLLRQVLKVPLSPEQARHYKEMRDELITFLGDKACTAQLAITKALRLQQIVSGHVPVLGDTPDQDETHYFKDTPREEALEELLENLLGNPKHKVIIWSCWRATYPVIRMVCERLEAQYVELTGDTPGAKREEAVERFRTDPKCQVLIGNQSAAGIGINLVEAQYMIYYSRNFRLEDDLQSEARNYRGGSEQHQKITRYDLVAQETIDEEIQDALARKQAIGEALLHKALKR